MSSSIASCRIDSKISFNSNYILVSPLATHFERDVFALVWPLQGHFLIFSRRSALGARKVLFRAREVLFWAREVLFWARTGRSGCAQVRAIFSAGRYLTPPERRAGYR